MLACDAIGCENHVVCIPCSRTRSNNDEGGDDADDGEDSSTHVAQPDAAKQSNDASDASALTRGKLKKE